MLRRTCPLAFLVVLAQSCSALGGPAAASPSQDLALSPTPPPEGTVIFQIDPSASEVRFVIGEIRNGSPNSVVGVTQEVRGEISVDADQPSSSVVGPIQIDADSFVTDNGFRNEAISRFILEAGSFPTITFLSTALESLSSPGSVGQTYTFNLTGDLAIRDVTRPVRFEVMLTAESTDRLTGSATATIQRSDFGLTIPSVPQVAEVSDEVTVEFDFTAVRVGS